MTTAERFAFEPCADLDALRDDWIDLASGSDNVFATYEWLSTWWRHFGRGRPLWATTVRDADGQLVAILPLYLAARRPIRILRLLGHGATDQLGPVCAVADRDRARRALGAFLAEARQRWDLAIADDLAIGDDRTVDRAGARRLDRYRTQVASLEGTTGADWFAARSPDLRSQLARATRRLERIGAVTHRCTEDPAHIGRDLDLVLELHRRRWAPHGGSRAFAGREAFHHDVAQVFGARGWLRLRFLEVDGAAVAGLYSFRFDQVESNYQSGRDPAFDRCSVGLLLHRIAIEASANDGLRAYRFLRGDEPYKRRLADAVVEQESVAWARGAVGRAALATVAQRPRLTPAQARWLPAPVAWGTGGTPRWGRP